MLVHLLLFHQMSAKRTLTNPKITCWRFTIRLTSFFIEKICIYPFDFVSLFKTNTYVVFYHKFCEHITINQNYFYSRCFFAGFNSPSGKSSCRNKNAFRSTLFSQCTDKFLYIRFLNRTCCITFGLNINIIKTKFVFFYNTINAVIMRYLCYNSSVIKTSSVAHGNEQFYY